ncbi:MAG: haloacid dehalogenase-like hydrolase [Treponema sp.]|nr:haloacid dehalogenase-like hydrolase [Treponema sp.]
MKKSFKFVIVLALVSIAFVSCCRTSGSAKNPNPLSLWTDTAPAKKALIEYMKSVTDEKSPDFIPVEDRIAIFDLDGTLILETDPTYFDQQIFDYRVLDDPSFNGKATDAQKKAALESRNERKYMPLGAERENLVASVYGGMTLDEFDSFVRKFMATDQPGFNGMKRGETFYKPMVQVVEFLTENDFTVYVSSGSNRFLVRPLVFDNLHLPATQIIGSDVTVIADKQGDKDGLSYTFVAGDGLILGGKSIVKNLQMNKVVTIVREIGKKPVLAFGNSGTDASMLNYSINDNKYKALAFMLMCDDLVREYGNMEKADKMKQASAENNWIAVSMRDDWKTIYGDGVTRK